MTDPICWYRWSTPDMPGEHVCGRVDLHVEHKCGSCGTTTPAERDGGIGSDRVEPTLPASTTGLDHRADTDGGSST